MEVHAERHWGAQISVKESIKQLLCWTDRTFCFVNQHLPEAPKRSISSCFAATFLTLVLCLSTRARTSFMVELTLLVFCSNLFTVKPHVNLDGLDGIFHLPVLLLYPLLARLHAVNNVGHFVQDCHNRVSCILLFLLLNDTGETILVSFVGLRGDFAAIHSACLQPGWREAKFRRSCQNDSGAVAGSQGDSWLRRCSKAGLCVLDTACHKDREELHCTRGAAGDRPDPICAKAAKLNTVPLTATKPSSRLLAVLEGCCTVSIFNQRHRLDCFRASNHDAKGYFQPSPGQVVTGHLAELSDMKSNCLVEASFPPTSQSGSQSQEEVKAQGYQAEPTSLNHITDHTRSTQNMQEDAADSENELKVLEQKELESVKSQIAQLGKESDEGELGSMNVSSENKKSSNDKGKPMWVSLAHTGRRPSGITDWLTKGEGEANRGGKECEASEKSPGEEPFLYCGSALVQRQKKLPKIKNACSLSHSRRMAFNSKNPHRKQWTVASKCIQYTEKLQNPETLTAFRQRKKESKRKHKWDNGSGHCLPKHDLIRLCGNSAGTIDSNQKGKITPRALEKSPDTVKCAVKSEDMIQRGLCYGSSQEPSGLHSKYDPLKRFTDSGVRKTMRCWSPLPDSQLSVLDSVLCNILPHAPDQQKKPLGSCNSCLVERAHRHAERSPFTTVVGKGPHFFAEEKDGPQPLPHNKDDSQSEASDPMLPKDSLPASTSRRETSPGVSSQEDAKKMQLFYNHPRSLGETSADTADRFFVHRITERPVKTNNWKHLPSNSLMLFTTVSYKHNLTRNQAKILTEEEDGPYFRQTTPAVNGTQLTAAQQPWAPECPQTPCSGAESFLKEGKDDALQKFLDRNWSPILVLDTAPVLIECFVRIRNHQPFLDPRSRHKQPGTAATITDNNYSALQFIAVHRTAGHSGMLHPKAHSKSLFKPKYKAWSEPLWVPAQPQAVGRREGPSLPGCREQGPWAPGLGAATWLSLILHHILNSSGIHTGEDLSVPIQILIQKHLSPKAILDKIIKKQIINVHFKAKSKATEADPAALGNTDNVWGLQARCHF
ncbi:hypothetical protein EK904_012301 [Melospiza melodia maxima]|nr:hypothetical protein EK904_012301 [Melospiza melodia maxima]